MNIIYRCKKCRGEEFVLGGNKTTIVHSPSPHDVERGYVKCKKCSHILSFRGAKINIRIRDRSEKEYRRN